jgi:hypothetical protein
LPNYGRDAQDGQAAADWLAAILEAEL